MLLQVAGKDATAEFYSMHRHSVLQKYDATLCIGTIAGEKPQVKNRAPGELNTAPFSEPSWLLPGGETNPYYKESHRRLQKAARKFTDEYLRPAAEEIEDSGAYPSKEFFKTLGANGVTRMRLGPGKHLHGQKMLGDVDGKEFDYFHELVLTQEMVCTASRSANDAIGGGTVIGLPPVLKFCKNKQLHDKITSEVFSGESTIALAISEAFAGSDVSGLRTTAKKSADGSHFIVNGTKKWITNGQFSTYFTTAVRTDKGLSVLLIPRALEGVSTSQIKTSYSTSAGTAFITFDDVKVPADHILGIENKGLPVILANFNHERWVMTCGAVRSMRVITTECFRWAAQRYVFGKPLNSLAVIRQKLAHLVSLCEASQSWLETVTAKMNQFGVGEDMAGEIALLKAYVTKSAETVADEAVQIFGGRGITKGGMGGSVENYARNVKFDSILGGSIEVLEDLAVRMAVKETQKQDKVGGKAML